MEEKIYYWTEVNFQTMFISPETCTTEGSVVRCNCRLKGESTKKVPCEPRSVRFDRTYIFQILDNMFKRVPQELKEALLNDYLSPF